MVRYFVYACYINVYYGRIPLDDKVKGELLSNIWYKICDFLYQFIFIDMGACIVINIIISGKWLKDWFVQTDIHKMEYSL